jgi:hypothetical protein
LPTWQKTQLVHKLDTVEDWTTSPPGNRTYDPATGQGTPGGAWTFGTLMRKIANTGMTGISEDQFARRWLKQWASTQMVNGDPIPARPNVASILNTWEIASGGPGSLLNMDEAPFRLLAIVNRLDLRGNVTYGGGSSDPCNPACNSGEARFVFCFCGHKADPASTRPQFYGQGGTAGGTAAGDLKQFLVIFEYCVPRDGCRELMDWACKWAELECLSGEPYNAALQNITDEFTAANAMPHRPNGSALSQLRTNENLLDPLWELREFRIFSTDSDAGHLRSVTVKQTPAGSLNNMPQLSDYLTATVPPPPGHTVPLEWAVTPGNPVTSAFLGASATMSPINPTGPGGVAPFWNTLGGPIVGNPLRHDFALNTCNGCHEHETGARFVHVGCRPNGGLAPLSSFLLGNNPTYKIPNTSGLGTGAATHFADLKRRELDLVSFIMTPCGLHPFGNGGISVGAGGTVTISPVSVLGLNPVSH